MLCAHQNAGVKTPSIFSETRVLMGVTRTAGFMNCTAAAAVELLGLPTSALRNRNCRERLLTSMWSSSVTVTSPSAAVATPMQA